MVIIKSCYFDYRINKPFTYSRCVICVSCSVHVIPTYYVRKGSWAFILITHKSTRSEDPITSCKNHTKECFARVEHFFLPEAWSRRRSRRFSDRPTISTAETRTEKRVPVLKRRKLVAVEPPSPLNGKSTYFVFCSFMSLNSHARAVGMIPNVPSFSSLPIIEYVLPTIQRHGCC